MYHKIDMPLPLTPEEAAHHDRVLSQYASNPSPVPFPIYAMTSLPAYSPSALTKKPNIAMRMKFIPQRQKLASFASRNEVIMAVKEKQCVGITCTPNPTACGTATQLPQILTEHDILKTMRAYVVRANDSLCRSSANRAATEMCCESGSEGSPVWYSPLHGVSVTPTTQIVYVTASTMLHILQCRHPDEREFAIIIDDVSCYDSTAATGTELFTLLCVCRDEFKRATSLLYRLVLCGAADALDGFEKWHDRYVENVCSSAKVRIGKEPPTDQDPTPYPRLLDGILESSSVDLVQTTIQTIDASSEGNVFVACGTTAQLQMVQLYYLTSPHPSLGFLDLTHCPLLLPGSDFGPRDEFERLQYPAKTAANSTATQQRFCVLTVRHGEPGGDGPLIDTITDVFGRTKESFFRTVVVLHDDSGVPPTQYNASTNSMVASGCRKPETAAGYLKRCKLPIAVNANVFVSKLDQDAPKSISNEDVYIPQDASAFISDDIDMDLTRYTLVCKALGVDPYAHTVTFPRAVSVPVCVTAATNHLFTHGLVDRSDVITTYGSLVAFLGPLGTPSLLVSKLLLLGCALSCADFATKSAAKVLLRERGVNAEYLAADPSAIDALSLSLKQWLIRSRLLGEREDMWNMSGGNELMCQTVLVGAHYPNVALYSADGRAEASLRRKQVFNHTTQQGAAGLVLFTHSYDVDVHGTSMHLYDRCEGLLLSGFEEMPLSLLPIVLFCGKGAVEGEYPVQLESSTGDELAPVTGMLCRGWYSPLTRAWFDLNAATIMQGGKPEEGDESTRVHAPVVSVTYTEALPGTTCLGAVITDDRYCFPLESTCALPLVVALRKAYKQFFFSQGEERTLLPEEVLQETAWCLSRTHNVVIPDVPEDATSPAWLPYGDLHTATALVAPYRHGGPGQGVTTVVSSGAEGTGGYKGPTPSAAERPIIEQVVALIAQTNDRQMEEHVRLNQSDNPMFAFLDRSHPLYAYYEHRLLEVCPTIAARMPTDPNAIVTDELGEHENNLLRARGVGEKTTKREDYLRKLEEEGVIDTTAPGRIVKFVPRAQGSILGGLDVAPKPFEHLPPAEWRGADSPLTPGGNPGAPTMESAWANPFAPPNPFGGARGAPAGILPPPGAPGSILPFPGAPAMFQPRPMMSVQEATQEELDNGIPAVIVEPVPIKKKGANVNLPLIMAKALGEAIGKRVGPTVLLSGFAQIQVPSKEVAQEALDLGKFMCLGEELTVRRNTLVVTSRNMSLTKKFDIRGGPSDPAPGGGGAGNHPQGRVAVPGPRPRDVDPRRQDSDGSDDDRKRRKREKKDKEKDKREKSPRRRRRSRS